MVCKKDGLTNEQIIIAHFFWFDYLFKNYNFLNYKNMYLKRIRVYFIKFSDPHI